ncbi:MAG: hypothetical protein O2931_01330 [Planctomycetota bacterium]|nr:hypothetical protein [Planctomycetota bacterium]MDA1177415.1 hypothetical protein [Planctomycetota bacterium]
MGFSRQIFIEAFPPQYMDSLFAHRHTIMITQEQFKTLLPLACAWAEAQERVILSDGVALTPAQTADATTIGVAHPEKVRLLSVVGVPIPEHPALRAAAEATQLVSPHTGGLTLRYGIFIRADCWGDRRLVFHELVHTLQYERLGGFQQFLQQYLYECITIGYPAAPMEQEAVTTTARLCA